MECLVFERKFYFCESLITSWTNDGNSHFNFHFHLIFSSIFLCHHTRPAVRITVTDDISQTCNVHRCTRIRHSSSTFCWNVRGKWKLQAKNEFDKEENCNFAFSAFLVFFCCSLRMAQQCNRLQFKVAKSRMTWRQRRWIENGVWSEEVYSVQQRNLCGERHIANELYIRGGPCGA